MTLSSLLCRGLCLLLLSGLLAAQEVGPGEPVPYRDRAMFPDRWDRPQAPRALVPWQGKHVAFLTVGRDYDPAVMKRLLGRLDRGWEVYGKLVGQGPQAYRQLDGRAVIAAVPDPSYTCGYACGYLGFTGIEVGGFYATDYPLFVKDAEAFRHYYFYEMGRNHFVFGNRHSAFATGFAVFMRYVCMDALGEKDPDLSTRRIIEGCEERLAAAGLPFLEAFSNVGSGEKAHRLKGEDGAAIVPSDQPVIYAAAMLKLRRDLGGDAWVQRFFAALKRCPESDPKTVEGFRGQALSWMVAASLAARRDLSPIFCDRWGLVASAERRKALAAIDWKAEGIDPARLIGALPD